MNRSAGLAALVVFIGLSACSPPEKGLTSQERDQVSDIASAEAHDLLGSRVSELESQNADLESRIEELEERLGE
ncbi:MAG: hypothetical protein IT546_10345 [Caulobacteraceae bacterium]|nr:hypothetical protein [Caulobacteraceae bacterium]